MQISWQSPPVEPKHKQRYDDVMDALLEHPGQWLAVAPADVSGSTMNHKQNALRQAARIRGLRVQTTAQAGMLYLKTLPTTEEVTHAETRA